MIDMSVGPMMQGRVKKENLMSGKIELIQTTQN